MSFGNQLLDGNQIPISQAYVPGTGFVVTQGGTPTTDGAGNASAPVQTAMSDGTNVTQGATTDAAVVGDNSGSISAKLRGLTKIFNDVWDSVNHGLHVRVDNGNANGQSTMANSAPVAIASDQTAVKTKGDFTEVAGQGTGVVNGINTDLFPSTDVSGYKWASVQLTGTWSATLQVQLCNDNATFLQVQAIAAGTQVTNASLLSSFTANGLYVFPITSRYLRIRATTWASNASLVGTLELYTSTPPMNIVAMGTYISLVAQNTGAGTQDFHLISAASTNANNIKNGSGTVYGYEIGNSNVAIRYVKLYNKATAPSVGTDTPFRTILVPASGRAWFHSSTGFALGTGISIATTTGLADSDSTAVGLSDLAIEIDYK